MCSKIKTEFNNFNNNKLSKTKKFTKIVLYFLLKERNFLTSKISRT